MLIYFLSLIILHVKRIQARMIYWRCVLSPKLLKHWKILSRAGQRLRHKLASNFLSIAIIRYRKPANFRPWLASDTPMYHLTYTVHRCLIFC